jgi:hypothetical protein
MGGTTSRTAIVTRATTAASNKDSSTSTNDNHNNNGDNISRTKQATIEAKFAIEQNYWQSHLNI